MSKDEMLKSIVQTAVGVSEKRLELLAEIARMLAERNPNGEAWYRYLRRHLETSLPTSEAIFERNEHGHVVFTLTGLGLSGREELKALESRYYNVSASAKYALASLLFDAEHQLALCRKYRVVLLPAEGPDAGTRRTLKEVCEEAERLGYGRSVAGIMPRIRESISDKQMEEMGIESVIAFHEPLTGATGEDVLLTSEFDGFGGLLGDVPLKQVTENALGPGRAVAFISP